MSGDAIFVKDYLIDCHIGVYAEEHGTTQKVQLTVDAFLAQGVQATRDEMVEVPSYTDIIDAIDEISAAGREPSSSSAAASQNDGDQESAST